MSTKFIPLLSLFFIAMFVGSCFPPKFIQPPRQNFSFDYAPSEGSLARTDGNLSFALLKFQVMSYQNPTPEFTLKESSVLMDKLTHSLERDFSEIITAQGYGITGPFESHAEMTYPDKEATDLILFTKVVIQVDHTNLRWALYEESSWVGRQQDYGYGIRSFPTSVSIEASFEFHIYESLSKEKLWAKSITLDPLTIDLTYLSSGGIRYQKPEPSFEVMLEYDNSYHAAVGGLLEKEYGGIIDRMITYLHPKEMQRVHEAAKRVRAKKVY